MTGVSLSRTAQADLLGIDLQTIELFGFEQSVRTEAAFRRAFDRLAANPLLGQRHDELSPAGHSFRLWVVLKRFVIVYVPQAEGIRVARILDGARDLPAVLAQNPGDD